MIPLMLSIFLKHMLMFLLITTIGSQAPSKWERITSVCHNRHQIALPPSPSPSMCATITIADRLQSHPLFQASERARGGFIVTPQTATDERGEEQLQVRPTEKFPVVPCSFMGLSLGCLDFPCRHFRGCITRGLFSCKNRANFRSLRPFPSPCKKVIRFGWGEFLLCLISCISAWIFDCSRSNPLPYFFDNCRIRAGNA